MMESNGLAHHNQPKHHYTLAQQGLDKCVILTVIVFSVALITLAGGLLAFIIRGEGFLSGNQIVVIFFILAGSLVIYFAFVFERKAVMKGSMDGTKSQMEISAGNSIGNVEEK